MLKRISIVLGISSLLLLSGCATHQQANTAVGAGVGAAVGNAVGGRSGAAVGAVVGGMIGSQQPTGQHGTPGVYGAGRPGPVYPDYSGCGQYWNWEERRACQAGAEARAREEQNRRNREAYRYGYGR